MEQGYLCWGTAFLRIPIEREAAAARGSANRAVLASIKPNPVSSTFSSCAASLQAHIAAAVRSSGPWLGCPRLFGFSPSTRRAPLELPSGGFFSCTALAVGTVPGVVLLIATTVSAPFL